MYIDDSLSNQRRTHSSGPSIFSHLSSPSVTRVARFDVLQNIKYLASASLPPIVEAIYTKTIVMSEDSSVTIVFDALGVVIALIGIGVAAL